MSNDDSLMVRGPSVARRLPPGLPAPSPETPRPAPLLGPLRPLLLSPLPAFRCPGPAANEGPGPLWPLGSWRANLSPLVFFVHPELQFCVRT